MAGVAVDLAVVVEAAVVASGRPPWTVTLSPVVEEVVVSAVEVEEAALVAAGASAPQPLTETQRLVAVEEVDLAVGPEEEVDLAAEEVDLAVDPVEVGLEVEEEGVLE